MASFLALCLAYLLTLFLAFNLEYLLKFFLASGPRAQTELEHPRVFGYVCVCAQTELEFV